MKKISLRASATIISLLVLLSSVMLPLTFSASAETGNVDYSLYTDRNTWKFDTAPANENFQVNMKDAGVDQENGWFYAPTNWTQTQPVNYEFKAGKTYVVNIKWKVSAKPTDGFQFQLRVDDTAFKNYGWMSSVPTNWQTDRIQFTAANTGLLKIYMNAGTGETLYIDTISVYEVGSSVRFDFSDDTQLKAVYQDTNNGYSVSLTGDDTVQAVVVSQWSTGAQFVPDYVLENGKKYTVTFRYKANAAKNSNTISVNYNKGNGAWNGYHDAGGFATPSIKTTAANTWYTGSFEFTAANDSEHPYLGFALRPTTAGTYEFDDITICQSAGTVILDTMDGNTTEAATGGARAGSTYTLPTPKRAGCDFVAWYTEPEYVNEVTTVTVPQEGQSVTVYAKWQTATSYFLTFEDDSDLNLGTSWQGDCTPAVADGELLLQGSENANPSYARLPIILEEGEYSYSFKYKTDPINEGDTYTLYMHPGLNAATSNSDFNNAFSSENAEQVFNAKPLSTGDNYVTVSGTFNVTSSMLSASANMLTLRISAKTRYDKLYIDDFSFERIITREYDFSSDSQLGNYYSAEIVNEELVFSADAGQQARARLDCELKENRAYILTYKYRANKALDFTLTPWYGKSSQYNNWAFLGESNESNYMIPGLYDDYQYADTTWQTKTVRFVAGGNIDSTYKYLGFRMQSSLDGGKVYIDNISITECGRTLQFATNGGAAIDDLTYLTAFESIDLPVAVKENYSFDGWYYDSELAEPVGSSYSPNLGSPITFHAKWTAKTANATVPATPTVSLSNGVVSIGANSGYEYKLGMGEWQTENNFTGLIVGPSYNFYQRVAETDNTASSASSESTSFTLTTKGDFDKNGLFAADDLIGIRRNLLGLSSDEIDLVDANEDGVNDIRDLVKLKKLCASSSKFFIGNNDVSGYSIVNNSEASFISNKAESELRTAIETFAGISLTGASGKTISLNVTYSEFDTYTVSVSGGNIVFTASSDYMLLNAVRAFISRFENYNGAKIHIPNGFTISNEIVSGDYNITWRDEFSGEELDASKWTNSIYSIASGNNTIQRTCNAVNVSDGSLKLNTYSADKDVGKIWYGADIRTNSKFSFNEGYLEIRAKLPGDGNAASFWLNGSRDSTYTISNEVDVFETFGSTNNITTTIHAWTGNSEIDNDTSNSRVFKNVSALANNSSSVYHTYGCEWTSTGLVFYTDGVMTNQILYSDCSAEQVNYLQNGGLLNILLGTSTGYYTESGTHTYMNGTPRAATFEIDYIRLYQQ